MKSVLLSIRPGGIPYYNHNYVAPSLNTIQPERLRGLFGVVK